MTDEDAAEDAAAAKAPVESGPARSRRVKVGLVQESWRRDAAAHSDAFWRGVHDAASHGAQLVCLQELTLHRYFGDVKDPALFEWAEPLDTGPTSRLCKQWARQAGTFVVGSLFERTVLQDNIHAPAKTHYFNTAIVCAPNGELAGFTRKQHIPRGTGYNEDFYFEPGNSDYPVHDLGFIKLAVPTCYDQWFPELARIYALKGAELLVYPTAIGSEPDHPEFDSQPLWQHMMTSHAIANGVFVAAVNRTGDDDNGAQNAQQKVSFYGSSFVCDPTGTLLTQAPRHTPAVQVATLDFSVMAFWRKLFPLLQQRQPQTYQRLLQP